MTFDNTRDKIINVATQLFGRFGFHKTSIEEIAKLAKKSKKSVYYYFSNKEVLFNTVVLNEMEDLKANLNFIIEDPKLSAKRKLVLFLIKRMEIFNKATNYHETINADLNEHFNFTDDIRSDLDQWEKNSIKKILEEGIENNEFDKIEDINVLLDVYVMVIKGLEIPFYVQGKYEDYAPHFENLLKILTKGLSK